MTVTFHIKEIVIFVLIVFIAYIASIKTVNGEKIVPSSQSSLVDVKSNQEDVGGTQSNIVDIHLAMQSDNSLNLKNLIREELKSALKNFNNDPNSIDQNVDYIRPIEVRSVKDDFERSSVSTKLNYIATEFRTLKDELKSLKFQNGDNSSVKTCFEQKKALGVHYGTCNKIVKKKSDYPMNCKEVLQNGNNVTGIYEIYPKYADAPFSVLCDMETKGGGWTTIQKRFDGSEDFFREWRDYKHGFGNLEGEFWLGLQKMYLLTEFELSELLIEIVDRDNISAYAQYNSFAIGSESKGYSLDRLSGFSGDAGDSLTAHFGQKFSTKDLDFSDKCATMYRGAWWYKACHISNLNGQFINVDLPAKYNYQGLHWKTFRSHEYCHAKSRMLVRPAK